MLRVLVPRAGQIASVPAGEKLPADALWIDMLAPDPAEEQEVETTLGIDVPTRHEMREIEPTSRLYERDGALFMTATIVGGADTDKPVGEPITFILTGGRLVTVRYHDPQSFTVVGANAARQLAGCRTGTMALIWLLEAIVDRLADILEMVGNDLDRTSKELFRRSAERSKTLTSSFSDIVKRIGVSNDRTSKVHESLVSLKRLLGFLRLSSKSEDREQLAVRLKSLRLDVTALTDHVSYLSSNITFLLDASLGMIAIEQNGIIKIFSVMAVVFLPPTLVASIYGMNFDDMPELHWTLGYPFALGLMILAAVLPYWFFKKRGWL
jgi:magnesium transporter